MIQRTTLSEIYTIFQFSRIWVSHMGRSRGVGTGNPEPPPLENHKCLPTGFLKYTSTDTPLDTIGSLHISLDEK